MLGADRDLRRDDMGAERALSCSSVRKKSARSRSSMFTNSIRAMSSSAARAHRRLVDTSTPITRVDDEHRRLADAQGPQRIRDEARLARRVEQVDLALAATRTS